MFQVKRQKRDFDNVCYTSVMFSSFRCPLLSSLVKIYVGMCLSEKSETETQMVIILQTL